MIPASPQLTERGIRKKHLRVAPYCRVSTDSKEQLSRSLFRKVLLGYNFGGFHTSTLK